MSKFKVREYNQKTINNQDKFLQSGAKRGRVYAPTGSGKTVCFADVIQKVIDAKRAINEVANICIVYPRIALANDQQSRFIKIFNHKVHYTNFNTGKGMFPTDGNRNQISTTSLDDFETVIRANVEYGDNSLTFVTYHSFHKIAPQEFDLVICDECHYFTQRPFNESLVLINPNNKVLFYTATPMYANEIDNKEGLEVIKGLDDEYTFGKVISQIFPKELIEKGYIVKPKLIELRIKTKGTGSYVNPVQAISAAFKGQMKLLNKKINAKMLVAMSSTLEFDRILAEADDLQKLCKTTKNPISIYVVTAKEHRSSLNITFKSRKDLLDHFDKNTNQCIIIHCDTLAEGIDISGITGVFVFKNLKQSKFIQTIGRAARPLPADMDSDGEIIDINNRLKPNALITVPIIDGEGYSNLSAETICKTFIAGGYGDDHLDIVEYFDLEARECLNAVDEGIVRDFEEKKLKDIETAESVAILYTW